MSDELIDIGINLTHDSYDHDREEVLRRALDVGVVQYVVTGASLEGSRAAIALARAAPRILRATAGCHPHHAVDLDDVSFAQLCEIAEDPLIAAVGETGLDYHRNFSAPREQRLAFERQVELAIRLRKPLFLHERDAHADFMAILRERRRDCPPPSCIASPATPRLSMRASNSASTSGSPAGSAMNDADFTYASS